MILANIVPDFANEIRTLLADQNFYTADASGEMKVPTVFEHTVPPPQSKNDSNVPWVLVSLYNGEQNSPADPRTATLHIICMTIDANRNMQGHLDAINLIEMICQHLYSKVQIAGQYEMAYPYQFAVLDDAKYPYFEAGLSVKVEMQGATPQNPIGGYAYV